MVKKFNWLQFSAKQKSIVQNHLFVISIQAITRRKCMLICRLRVSMFSTSIKKWNHGPLRFVAIVLCFFFFLFVRLHCMLKKWIRNNDEALKFFRLNFTDKAAKKMIVRRAYEHYVKDSPLIFCSSKSCLSKLSLTSRSLSTSIFNSAETQKKMIQ